MQNNKVKERIQRRFLEIYSETLDIEKAAIEAGFKKQTALASALNFIRTKKNQHALVELCNKKAEMLNICTGYIVDKYVKILKWACCQDKDGKPNDPALALRALDGLTKQICALKPDEEDSAEASIPIIKSILNLDTNKI